MNKAEETIVITKTYDLILWSCHHTSRFPRNHRFVLGERIERNLYDLLETLLKAEYTRNQQALLQQANLTLEILRFPMRLARDLQCLKTNSYAFAARAVDEIGKLGSVPRCKVQAVVLCRAIRAWPGRRQRWSGRSGRPQGAKALPDFV